MTDPADTDPDTPWLPTWNAKGRSLVGSVAIFLLPMLLGMIAYALS
jgi:hypothetical protein